MLGFLPIFVSCVSYQFLLDIQQFPLLSLPASTHTFKLGSESTFNLINDVSLYDLKAADKPSVYRVSGAVKVGAIWGSDENGFLLRFEVISIILSMIFVKVSVFNCILIFSWNHRNYICKNSRLNPLILMRKHRF